MEGGSCSTCGSRRSAAHIRLKQRQQFQGLVRLKPRRCVLTLLIIVRARGFAALVSNNFTDSGRVVFKMWLSPSRRAHSFYICATVSRSEGDSVSKCGSRFSAHIRTVSGVEGGSFPKCGSRFNAAHIRFTLCRGFTDSHGQRSRNGVLEWCRIMRVQQLRWFALLKSQGCCSGTVRARQDATVRLIRGGGIPRPMCWHKFGPSHGCLPKRQFPH
eukprot:9469948-Pyramimonas_sp.AAC.1